MISFSYPAPCKRLSMNDRMHWARKAGITAAWRQAGHRAAKRSSQLADGHRQSNVRITFEVPDPGRRRDPFNAAPTVKAIVDGLTDSGLFWPDDNSRWVTVIEPRYIKGRDRFMVEIWPREEDDT